MRTIIYIGLVGFLSISGFFSLKNNDWEVRELPSFLGSTSSVDRVLPFEEWESILPGEWTYKAVIEDFNFKGNVSFNSDGSFVKQLGIENGDYYRYNDTSLKASGTVKGTWRLLDSNKWEEAYTSCNFSRESEELCEMFGESQSYGENESDIKNYKIVYFNYDRIEIRAEGFNGEAPYIWKYTRDN